MYFIFAALIILLDRISKMWIAAALEPGQVIQIIPGIIRLTYVENTGAAFSILADMRWLLIAVSSIAAIALVAVILLYHEGSAGRLGASFMLGGAVGNLIDRIMTGAVVDMFEPEFINFAVFNVADIFITVGGVIFIIHIIASFRKEPKQKEATIAMVETFADIPEQRSEPTRRPAAEPEIGTPGGGAPAEDVPMTEEQILEEYYLEQQMKSDDN